MLADWLICQGQEKIEEVGKDMFLILYMHFFIAYKARITQWDQELPAWINVLVIESNFYWYYLKNILWYL